MNTVKHAFVSQKTDGPDATLVQPSSWNAGHKAGVSLTNKTGGQLVSGDVVGLDDASDSGVVLADVSDTTRALVVAMETIENNAAGLFTATGAWTLKVNSATTRGNYLSKSTTSKALYDTGIVAASNPPPPGTVAIALTGSGGAGTVVGLILTSGAGGSGGVLFNGGNVAAASALNVGTSGALFHVTGTTTIDSITTRAAGHLLVLVFDGALTLTHNATTLILQGAASYTTVAGDVLCFISEGSGNWRQIAPFHEVLNFIQLGASPAVSGVVRLPNASAVTARDDGNTEDIQIAQVDNQNRIVLGEVDRDVVSPGQLRCDIEANARLVVPVGTNKWAVAL